MRSLTVESESVVDLRCPWCDRAVAPAATRLFQGTMYECECAARVLLAPPHDFDEAAEELLDHLGIAGAVAEPAQPVGSSGMLTVRAYDAAVARRRLAEILAGAAYETRPEDLELTYVRPSGSLTMRSWALWWRA